MHIDGEEVLLGDDIIALAWATHLPQLLRQLCAAVGCLEEMHWYVAMDEGKPVLPHLLMV